MEKTREVARPDTATRAAEFVAQICRNVERVDARLQNRDEFHARQSSIWDAVAAAGREVDGLVLAASRADLAVAR